MSRSGLHAVAVLYTGGCIAQLLKLSIGFSWRDMPYIIDWLIVLLGSIGATALLINTARLVYRGTWEKLVHVLIIIHLLGSVLLHAWVIVVRSHDVFGIFPTSYSYFALLYFGLFAWRSWTVKLQETAAS